MIPLSRTDRQLLTDANWQRLEARDRAADEGWLSAPTQPPPQPVKAKGIPTKWGLAADLDRIMADKAFWRTRDEQIAEWVRTVQGPEQPILLNGQPYQWRE